MPRRRPCNAPRRVAIVMNLEYAPQRHQEIFAGAYRWSTSGTVPRLAARRWFTSITSASERLPPITSGPADSVASPTSAMAGSEPRPTANAGIASRSATP